MAPAQAGAAVFYVDPDWLGERTGEARTPWTTLDRAAWRALDEALAGGPVAVYFSAREAGTDVNETTTAALSILRTHTSAHRLTLDGMSRYNTNDENPSWADYHGDSRFQITHDYPITTATRSAKRNCVTIRGFSAIAGAGGRGGQGIYYWGGDHVVIEHCEVTHHAKVAHGPGILFGYAWKGDGSPDNGGCTDVAIRHNAIHGVYGEGIYVGGSHDVDRPAHSDVVIEGNTVYDVAISGGEGDAIDVKDGSTNVIVRGNTLYMTTPGAGRDGIAFSSGGIIEGNFIYNFGRSGISLSTFWNAHPVREGTVVRSNIVVNTGGNPQYSWDYGIIVSGSPDGDQYTNVGIYNNTICGVRTDRAGGGTGLEVRRHATGARVRNNLVYDSAGVDFNAGEGCLAAHDHNLYYSPGDGAIVARYGGEAHAAPRLQAFEPHSIAAEPQFVRIDAPYRPGNLRLRATSPAIGAGVAIADFGVDFFGVRRGAVWGIGAAEGAADG